MTFIKFSERASLYDICVVGSGPAGTAVALSASKRGMKVVLLEAGERNPANPGIFGKADSYSNLAQHVPLTEASANGLGGSGEWWGGLCTPLDPYDFEQRDWPISYQDYAQWLDDASRFLGCSPGYEAPWPSGWPKQSGLLPTNTMKFIHTGLNPAKRHLKKFENVNGPDVILGATLSHFSYENENRIQAASFVSSSGEGLGEISARFYIIACGGLGSARILLNEHKLNPEIYANATPPGKEYLGHLTGSVATIRFSSPQDRKNFCYGDEESDAHAVRRFRLADETNARINSAFWAMNFSDFDISHGSACLSLKYVAKRLLGKGGNHRGISLSPHIANILRNPLDAIRSIGSLITGRLKSSDRQPDVLINTPDLKYKLKFHSEHLPNTTNSVSLSQDASEEALPALDIKFEFDEDNFQALLEVHKELRDLVNKSGRATIELNGSDEEVLVALRAQAKDGIHQIATTQMSSNPSDGVVDIDCRHHEVSNLFVVSTGIFPSSGQANPTLSVVAFALRLASHLGDKIATQSKVEN